MSNVFNRITKQYLKSVNTPDYPKLDWIINPAFIPDVDKKYIIVEGDDIREMTLEEKAVVDYVAPIPEPTLAEVKIKRQNEIKAETKAYILSIYPLEKQVSASLGIYPASYVTPMSSFIASCIEEENRCFDAVEAATTIAEIDAVIPVFPAVV
ncbi:hypothetical protein KKF61_07170 [Patescibacteria group bacterium]|nr:hypothetical protein [Patescibacteria group bacterium]